VPILVSQINGRAICQLLKAKVKGSWSSRVYVDADAAQDRGLNEAGGQPFGKLSECPLRRHALRIKKPLTRTWGRGAWQRSTCHCDRRSCSFQIY